MQAKASRFLFALGCLTVLAPTLMLPGCTQGRPSLWVTGHVVDQATGKPIAGARVTDDGYGRPPYRGASTDSAGCYRYRTWCEEHNVSAQARGYRVERKTLVTGLLNRDTLKIVDFKLAPE